MDRIPLGPFDLIRRAARGGMAEVWLAEHRDQGAPVAVKVMTGEYATKPEFVKRFGDEVRAVAALDHPGVVMVLDHGRIDLAAAQRSDRLTEGSPYLAMEYASGGTLAQLSGPMPWTMLKSVLLALLDALAHAHGHGVIHRDLKPANVLVASASDARPGIKLSDFGIAWAGGLLEGAEGAGEAIVGTPTYMAPEQIRGAWRDYGPWTDLYAYGCLAWWLVTGRPPFCGSTVSATLVSHLQRELPEIEARVPVPDGFEDWLGRLMAKAPAWRFQRAADAAWALSRLGDPEATQDLEAPWQVDPAFQETITAGQLTFGESWRLALAEPTDRSVVLGPDGAPRPAPVPETWKRSVPKPPPMQLVGAGLSLYGLRAVPLVGRESQRDLLWRELRRVAATGRSRVVLIEGPAGTGKSRLVEWLCRRSHEVGAADWCVATFSPEKAPGEALKQMGLDYLRLNALDRDAVAERVRRFLERHDGDGDDEAQEEVLIELLCPATETDIARGVQPVRLTRPREYYSGTRSTRRLLAQERPLVAWFDDVQWGLHGLGLALQVLRTQDEDAFPCLLVLTMRTEALDDRSDEARRLAKLMDFSGATRLRLGPLEPAAHSALVRGLLGLDAALAARVEERTGGNPLFAVQLVGSWIQRGVLEVSDRGFRLTRGATPDLPDDLHAVWSARIDRVLAEFSPQARGYLEVAACLGQTVDRAEWRRACDDPEGLFGDRFPGDEALRTALVDRLLVQRLAVGDRDSWSFVHTMLRESVERSGREAGRLAAHHESCAAMFKARADDPRVTERLGRHLLAAGQGAEALTPLLRGVHQRLITIGAHPAHALLATVLDAMGDLKLSVTDARWGEAWTLRARVLSRLGQGDAALIEAQRAATAAARHGWTEVALEALQTEAQLWVLLNRRKDAEARWSELLRRAESGGDHARRGIALAGLAELSRSRGDFLSATGQLDDALEALAQGHAHTDHAAALTLRGRCAEAAGDSQAAQAFYAQALEHFEAQGSGLGVAEALDRIARLALDDGRDAEARDHLQRALSRYEALGSERAFACRMRLARAQLRVDPSAVWGVVLGAESALGRLDHEGRMAAGHALQLVRTALDANWAAFDQRLTELAAKVPRQGHSPGVIAWLGHIAGELCVAAGEADRAARTLGAAATIWRAAGMLGQAAEVERSLTGVG